MENKEKFIVQKFSSFEEAEKADKEFYASLTMQERFDIYLLIRERYIKIKYGTDPGFQRVYSAFKRQRN